MPEDRYAYFQRKSDERVQARADAAQNLRAVAAAAVPEATPTPTRSFGFRNTGGARAAAEPTNLAQAAELGAPTSFEGGEGAPTPIGVIRGMKQTNAVDAGGPQLSEFATPLQAKQAFNRNAGVGEYVPPEGPKLQAAADIDPTGQRAVNLATAADKEAASAKTAVTDHQGTYRKSFLGDHGDFDKEKQTFGMPADENLSRIYQKGANLVQGGATAPDAYKAIQPDIEKHYYTPENVDRALNSISQRTGQPITPQWRANAMSGTPEAMSALYPEIRNTLNRPKPGFWANAGKNLTTNTDPFATTP
jgi:hypothetical protein